MEHFPEDPLRTLRLAKRDASGLWQNCLCKIMKARFRLWRYSCVSVQALLWACQNKVDPSDPRKVWFPLRVHKNSVDCMWSNSCWWDRHCSLRLKGCMLKDVDCCCWYCSGRYGALGSPRAGDDDDHGYYSDWSMSLDYYLSKCSRNYRGTWDLFPVDCRGWTKREAWSEFQTGHITWLRSCLQLWLVDWHSLFSVFNYHYSQSLIAPARLSLNYQLS